MVYKFYIIMPPQLSKDLFLNWVRVRKAPFDILFIFKIVVCVFSLISYFLYWKPSGTFHKISRLIENHCCSELYTVEEKSTLTLHRNE